MMTLLEARDSIMQGIGTNEITSSLLRTISVDERANALYWIQEHLDKARLAKTEYGAVEDLMQDTLSNEVMKPLICNSTSEMGKNFAVLQELRNLVLHGVEPTGKTSLA